MKPAPDRVPADGDDESDLLQLGHLSDLLAFVLVRAPSRHKLLAVAAFVAVVGISIAALYVLPKRWEVQASVLAQSNPLAQGAMRDADRLRAAREIVTRRDNLLSLFAQTNFVERHMQTQSFAGRVRTRLMMALGQKLTDEERLDGLLDAVESRLWVVAGEEGTITIGFQWSDPELAFNFVKAAMQGFVEARKAVEVSSFSETISILEVHASNAQREIGELSQRLAAKEQQLRKARIPRRAPVRVRVAPDLELAKLDALLDTKKRALRVMEDFRERRITELRAELEQQQMTFAPAHPVLIATRRSLEAMTQRPAELDSLRAEVADLEREIKSRGSRPGEAVKLVQDDLAEARLQLEDEDPRLEQERHELRLAFRNYSSLLADIAAARVAQDAARVGFKYRYSVVSPPQMPKGPVWPKQAKILVAGLLGGILLALFAAAAADLRTGLVVERWQLNWHLGLPLIAELPHRKSGD